MKSINDWDGKFPKKHDVEWCGKKMTNGVCECGAYFVFEETYNLPLTKQPYYNGNKN